MMRAKVCSVLLLLSVFELNLCLIQVDSDNMITVSEPSVADFNDFTIYRKIERDSSQVSILEDRTYLQCKFAVKEVRYLKDNATDANTDEEKTYIENGHEFKYLAKEAIDNELAIAIKLSNCPHYPKYYTHFEEEHEEFIKSFLIMEYIEGENLNDLIERVNLFN